MLYACDLKGFTEDHKDAVQRALNLMKFQTV